MLISVASKGQLYKIAGNIVHMATHLIYALVWFILECQRQAARLLIYLSTWLFAAHQSSFTLAHETILQAIPAAICPRSLHRWVS